MKIMVIGSMNIDYVYHVDHFVQQGETLKVNSRNVVCGGKGLNQSIAMAKAGLDVMAAGLIGTEGTILLEALKENNVDTSQTEMLDQPNGHALIQVNAEGDNCILYCPSTNMMFTKDKIEACLNHLETGDVLVLQNETNLVPEMIGSAHEKGIRVCFNASPVSADIKDYPLEKCTWIFINENEGEGISGYADPQDILDFFVRRCPDTGIILTLGEEGAWYSDRNVREYCEAFKVDTADTTGAGDTFTGYFLQAVLCGKNSTQALRQASAAAAIAVTRPGAAPSVPRMEEVTEFMKRSDLL
ncbi:MAG: ribokinase [Erysipelotrichaceae bacterium]|nr:ribokinase [Erysipelotrichaceae bacterium]